MTVPFEREDEDVRRASVDPIPPSLPFRRENDTSAAWRTPPPPPLSLKFSRVPTS